MRRLAFLLALAFCAAFYSAACSPSAAASTAGSAASRHRIHTRKTAARGRTRKTVAHTRHYGKPRLRAASLHRVRLAPESHAPTALIDPVPLAHFVTPAPLKGSHESLVRQNERAEADGLSRIQDDAELISLRRQRALVALPATAALRVDERLPDNRRYTRPWTAQFLSDLSRIHYQRFHRPLQVNSAVRTVAYQRRLIEVNGNAAPADGDVASPHLTGAAVDIAKKGLSLSEIGWMRAYLLPLQAAGKVDVEEEFQQSCFHITVYRAYQPATPATRPRRGTGAALLAAGVR